MFLRYIQKNLRRSAVTNALFCLLLALAGALFALSAGLWFSVYRTERNLDDIITTIALPDMYAIRRYAGNVVKSGEFSGITTSWGMPLEDFLEQSGAYYRGPEQLNSLAIPYIESYVMNQISERVYDSGLLRLDDRRIYGAYARGIDSVPLRITESGGNSYFIEQYPQFIAAFVVNCVEVEEVYDYNWSSIDPAITRSFIADFRVEQDVYVHHARFPTQTVTGYFPCTNPDGSAPVQEGKRYLIVGQLYSQSGDIYTDNPTWYNSLPLNRNMPNALYIGILGSNVEIVDTAVINEMYEFSSNILPYLIRFGVNSDSLPMLVREMIPGYDPEIGYEGYTWFELDGSLEDALASDRGDFIKTALSVAEISHNSLMALTTDDINSIQRFNQRTNKFVEGRAFNAAEIAQGARVCVISEQLALLNDLSVGDSLPLRLYPTTLGNLSSGADSVWPPSAYHPGLELTEAADYVIVGIYSGLAQEMRDHSISPNIVIIPASSFEGAQGTPTARMNYSSYDPPLLYTIIVPNDGIEEGKALIESAAQGFGGFFRFFDQGYATLKPILSNLRFSMTWILALAAVGWLIAVAMFSVFYIGRKGKEIALLYGIGVSKLRGFLWVYMQSAFVIVIGQCIVLAVSVTFFSNILEAAVSATTSFTEIYRDFTLSDMNIAGGVRLALPLETSPSGVILATSGIAVLLLAAAGFFSARVAKRSSLMIRGIGE